jgi:hypothetical protein
VALTVAILLGSASAARAAGEISGFTFTPSSTQAGGDPKLSTSLTFSYASSSESLTSVAFLLPPGMFLAPGAVSNPCTTTQLTANQCPVSSEIGTGTGTYLGVDPVPITLYLMAAPSPSDEAGVGIVFSSPLNGQLSAATGTGTIDMTTANSAPQQLLILRTLPTFFQIPGSSEQVGQLDSLSLSLDGTSASNAPFTRMPTTCTTGTVYVVANSTQVNGSYDSATVTPTGCTSLAFSPQLAVAARKDSGDAGTAVGAVLRQTGAQEAGKSFFVTFPSSLVVNPSSGTEACSSPTATFSNCTSIGSVSAIMPLFASPLTGSIYLTKSSSGVAQLTLAFPAPFAFDLVGSFGPTASSLSFGLPDVPLTALGLFFGGGADSLYATACAPSSGTATSVLGDQNGDRTATPSSTFTIAGCSAANPAPTPTPTVTQGRPTLSGVHFSGLTGRHPRLAFTMTAGSKAPALSTLTVTLPSGIGAGKHHVAITGGRLKSARVTGGKLVVTLKSPARRVGVTITSLTVTKGLARKIRRRATKTLRLTVAARDLDGTTTTRTATAKA